MTPNLAAEAIAALVANIERVIVGKRETVERTVVALISGGHVLIEDVPGVGKTMLARSLALSIGGQFQRIQFTPDLLPTDVTGISVYDQSTQRFEFRKGPVFANILLADEINRAGPRTQSALLEAMEEHQVTQDGVTYPLPDPFMVIATENPIEYEGVYPLPESQLDRFLLRLELGYPSREEEKTVVKRQLIAHPVEALEPVASSAEVARVNQVVRACHVAEDVYNYALDIIQATRESESLRLGASPRGTLGLIRCAQALATLRGRDFVSPDEIKELAPSVLAHRVILRPEARMSGQTANDLILRILDRVRVPA
ncbi:MAG: MoxR family ATPase [Acidobacteriota bacterium]|jgi:MoxR-like ATPase|nr:MoxR family ATPase [Acidobacteriota bacterium]